jgi:mannan endo-1,4-beta-mannosidase
MNMQRFIVSALTCLFLSTTAWASAFVEIKNGHFQRQGKPYFFMGANFWQGMNLGAKHSTANRQQLKRELDLLKLTGVTQLRILGLSEGPGDQPYRIVPAVQNAPGQMDESILAGLDFLLNEMRKRDMTAVVCLGNFWPWSGGFAQYVSWFEGSSIPYPPPHPGGSWSTFQEYSSRFYLMPQAIAAQREAVRKILTRVNTINGVPYSFDPTILSWELANEPRGGTHRPEFLSWVESSAKFIKSIDPRHLVTIGSEGNTLTPEVAGNHFVEDHSVPGIDYATIHVWVENWGVFNPNDLMTFPASVDTLIRYIKDHVSMAASIQKPLILEEFGMARDQRSMDPFSQTYARDRYFDFAFQETLYWMKQNAAISGVNFWAWSGESKPARPGGIWKVGDVLLGDPPHEEQGWYGVYSSDTSTLNVIRKHAHEIQSLNLFRHYP